MNESLSGNRRLLSHRASQINLTATRRFFYASALSVSLAASSYGNPPPQSRVHRFPTTKAVETAPSGALPVKTATKVTSVPAIRSNLVQAGPTWTAVGPAPLPNGQTQPADANGISLTQSPVSGRTNAIAIDPTDPNIAYVGGAQAGVYRTLNGGSTWTPLMDNASAALPGNLAIGSLQLDPTDRTTLIVGTGESNFSGDSYAGVGVYKITNANATPTLTGPFATSDGTTNVLARRGIPGLAIDPNNHDNVYVGTATAQAGIGLPPISGAPIRGLYRSTNFFSGAGTFQKIALRGETSPADYRVTSIIYEPGSSDHLFVGLADTGGTFGGIYYSTNASTATPTFTKIFAATGFSPIKLALNKIGNIVTVAAVTGEANTPVAPATSANAGKAYKASYDATAANPTVTFTELPAAAGFAGGQGSYNLGVAIDPSTSSNIYVVGTVSANGAADGGDGGHPVSAGTSPTDGPTANPSSVDTGPNGIFIYSRDGGTTFTASTDTLHADSHLVGVAPSNPSIIYTGNDGGIWKSIDAGVDWINVNTSTFSATQFQSVAVHPTDRNFSLGGTQDNGTEFMQPGGKFKRADFGDGGYALIDPVATDTTTVTMYHTYFNQANNLIGFGRVKTSACATEGQWAFRGTYPGIVPDNTPVCDGSPATLANGIVLTDTVNFYAPMALGPPVTGSTGSTFYFGTDKLYRSINQGDTMTAVSQLLQNGVAISDIAISPTNDNVRIVGENNGHIFATVLGAATLTDITQAGMPAKYVARVRIDPNNPNVAYAVYNGNAILGQHIWRTTNLNLAGTGTVTWTAIDNANIPDYSVNAFAIDPASNVDGSGITSNLYAGTDNGVYVSTNSGTNWSLYGTGLPPVAVFDLAIQNSFRVLRAATHGRGFYDIPAFKGPVQLNTVVSRKTHGTGGPTFDIPLPLTGAPGVECRSGGVGNNFTLVFTFANTLSTAGTPVVSSGTGTVSSSSTSGNTITVNLSGVTNAQTVVVTIPGVGDGINASSVQAAMGVLLGDTTGNGFTNASDIAQTKSQSGLAISSTNFREDVNADGNINSVDISLVKSKTGTALP